jgi:hypothetical protein
LDLPAVLESTIVWVRVTVAYYEAALRVGRVGVVAVSRRVQTLLFTDIVGSTDRLRELGMRPGRRCWAATIVSSGTCWRHTVAAR